MIARILWYVLPISGHMWIINRFGGWRIVKSFRGDRFASYRWEKW